MSTDDYYARDLNQKWQRLQSEGQERQQRAQQVSAARRGAFQEIMPGVFPTNWPKPVVANIIDTTARDMAEMLARMPAIDCSSSELNSDRSKKFSSKRTRIALGYVEHSRLRLQLYSGCDWLSSFAAMPVVLEPDFDEMKPRIRVDDPRDAYWTLDFYGNVTCYARKWEDSEASLCAKFPELASYIRDDGTQQDLFTSAKTGETKLQVVKMYSGNKITLFMPDRKGLILDETEHKMKAPPVVVAERPRWDKDNRGQFDDVMWVWLARARMAVYGLEAAEKAVRAPLAVPNDVTQISFGADAIIRTENPEKVRRVPIELPQASLVEPQILDKEIADGTRTPAARRGDIDASIVTGRGVEALTSIYQTQLATLQDVMADTLRRVLGMAFEMDETYWPDSKKTARGVAAGAPFTESYTPSKDIKGDYTATVTYGMTAGMDPNRAIVFLLQLRADQAIDRDTMQRMLPFDIDVEDLQRRVDIEQINDALKQGLFALLANAPMMGEQGIDPLGALQKAAQVVKARQNGTPIHEAILEAYTPEPQPEGAAAADPVSQLMEQMMGGGGGPGGEQVPGDQTSTMGAGTAPDVQMILAGLTNGGQPNLQANVSRRLGTGI